LTPESSGEESIGLDRIVRAAALHWSRRAEREDDAESEGNAHCKHLRKKPFFSPGHYKMEKKQKDFERKDREGEECRVNSRGGRFFDTYDLVEAVALYWISGHSSLSFSQSHEEEKGEEGKDGGKEEAKGWGWWERRVGVGMHNRISSKRRKELCRGNMRRGERKEEKGKDS
jgi:hypothetical protein